MTAGDAVNTGGTKPLGGVVESGGMPMATAGAPGGAVGTGGVPGGMVSTGGSGGDERPPCDPPLTLGPATSYTASYDLVTFDAAGGTGNWRYALGEDASGAILNEFTGVYLAGPEKGTKDVVVLTDAECAGSVTADVFVVDDVSVLPSSVEVRVGGQIAFDALGGSGVFEYELVENLSGARVDAEGLYTAGESPGTDVLRVSDPRTGLDVTATVSVVESAQLVLSEKRLFIVQGSTIQLEMTGGSGHIEAIEDDPIVRFTSDGTLTALTPGRTRLLVADKYTDVEAILRVDVATSLETNLVNKGRGQSNTIVRGVGDLNGDGFNDLVIASSEASSQVFSDGIVAVYQGTAEGIDPNPVQIFNGQRRDDQFGRAVVVADVSGDGRKDLIVGVINDDGNGSNAGAAKIYHGVENGFFAQEESQRITGARAGDQFGEAAVACDFNGDGFLDLAVSAQRYEKRSRDLGLSDQGGIFIFLGGEDGLEDRYSSVVDGHYFNGDDQLVPRGGIRIGLRLAAGYMDADNLCDLAVGTVNLSLPNRRSAGMVHIYQGRAPIDDPDYPDPGGIEELPSRIIVGDENGVADGNLGRRLAVGDLNGDDLDDLIIGHHGLDQPRATNRGAVRVFSGGPLDGPVQMVTSVSDADWSYFGNSGNDDVGISVALADVNGDDIADLMIGAWRDESEADEAPGGTGAMHVFHGNDGMWPAQEPTFSAFGMATDDYFGEDVTRVGDVDGDGVTDFVVRANRVADVGVRVGRSYVVSGADGSLQPLDFPYELSGHRFGRGLAVGDLNGDGQVDVVVGAPDDARMPNHLAAGTTHIFSGDQDGRLLLNRSLSGHIDHNGGDGFGHNVHIGDFDGDGAPDLIIGAFGEERPNNLGDENYVRDGNCRRNSQSGAVYVYRNAQLNRENGRPDFIIYGNQNNLSLDALTLADVNGDGRADIIAGSHLGDTNGRDAGSFRVYLGREADPDGRVRLMCDPALVVNGSRGSAQLGRDAKNLGDLNGDGCDEIAITEPNRRRNADSNSTDGAVWIVFGWSAPGGQCPRANPQHVIIVPDRGGIQLGSGLTKVDGAPNTPGWLAVGAVLARRQRDNQRTGGVYLIDLDWVLARARRDIGANDVPLHSVEPGMNAQVFWGQDNEERFGQMVRGSGSLLIVGHTYRQYGESRRVGGATLYRTNRFGADPIASFVGETFGFEGLFGGRIAFDAASNTLVIGAVQGLGNGAQAGSAYVFRLTELDD